MKRLIFSVLFIALLLQACSDSGEGLPSSEQKSWDLMLGHWYGTQKVKEGWHHEWIVLRNADGTYNIRARAIGQNGVGEEVMQKGDWSIVGHTYFTIVRSNGRYGAVSKIDPSDPRSRNAYTIISLGEDKFVYTSFKTGEKFTVIRVDDDFDFPEKGKYE